MKHIQNHISDTMRHTRIVPLLIAALCVFMNAAPGMAQSKCVPGFPCPEETIDTPVQNGGGACDANFMNQIHARAFLEAERENVSFKTAIRKPDSVLEYSCFVDQAATVSNASALFSGSSDLSNMIMKTVIQSLDSYVSSNFDHAFMGAATEGKDIKLGSACDLINQVYKASSCSNFDLEFLTFKELAENDPRITPCNENAIYDGLIDLAENKDFQYVTFDEVKTYEDQLEPGTCKNQPPIPTGRIVTIKKPVFRIFGQDIVDAKEEEFDEYMCSNPSCFYNYNKKRCEPS